MNAPRPIDLAYREINALGGYVNERDPIEIARDELLGEILAILEAHGARDVPLIPSPSFVEHQSGFVPCAGY